MPVSSASPILGELPLSTHRVSGLHAQLFACSFCYVIAKVSCSRVSISSTKPWLKSHFELKKADAKEQRLWQWGFLQTDIYSTQEDNFGIRGLLEKKTCQELVTISLNPGSKCHTFSYRKCHLLRWGRGIGVRFRRIE